MIHGGWEFVWGAYGLTWFVLTSYGFSLWQRHRRLSKREKNSR
ncbi:MAG: hypothetical protein Q7S98_03805 [Deltaproteobacteria bacterium]|nr:hypothetical protein [Deltaproteobacteria bacterium]